MNLRNRLILFSVGLIAMLSTIGALTWGFVWQRGLPAMRTGLEQKTLVLGRSLTEALVVPLATDDEAAARRLLDNYAHDPDIAQLRVTLADGRTLANVGRNDGASLASESSAGTVTAIGTGATFWAPIEVEGLPLGQVEVFLSSQSIEQFRTLLALLGIIAVVLSLAAAAFATRYAARFVAPFQQMTEFSTRVAQGEFGKRIALSGAPEILHLGDRLNDMSEALEARDTRLAEQHRKLSASVDALRFAQEELLHSTRLASVGEMAGRTAHEVLNPVTSIHGRLTRMATKDEAARREALETLQAIIEGWTLAYRAGGSEGLMACLSEPATPGESTTLLVEDLANLEAIGQRLSDDTTKFSSDVAFLRRELDRITNIVDGMRSLTRVRGSVEPIKVVSLLAEARDILEDSATKRHVEIHLHADSRTEIDVDRFEFIQVLTNLMRNAVMAIEERHGRDGGTLTLDASSDAHRAKIRIVDDGCGIDAAAAANVFEANYTTRAAAEGTGLGLSIARRLVRSRGGELSLERSVPNQGSTFLVDLPLSGVDDQSATEPTSGGLIAHA